MVDSVNNGNLSPLQRVPQPAPVNLRSNQNIAQTLINQVQNSPSAKGGTKLAATKSAGFATDLPPGSLVDILV